MPAIPLFGFNTQLAGVMMLHAITGCVEGAMLTVGPAGMATAVHSLNISYSIASVSTYRMTQRTQLEVATRTPIKPKPIS